MNDGLSWPLASVGQDLRFALRMMGKNLGFSIVAVATLALGIGATTTVYGWIDAIVLHPLSGVGNPNEIVALESLTPKGEPITSSYPDLGDFREQLKLVNVAAARHTGVSVGEPGHSEPVAAQFVSGNYFDLLEVKAALGRVFGPQEYPDTPRAFPLVVISHRLWRSHFNSDPQIIGKTVKVNRNELSIIGVVPEEFHGSLPGYSFDIWILNVMRPQLDGFHTNWQLADRNNRDMPALARLKTGVTLIQAQAEIAAVSRHLAQIHPDTNAGITATLVSLWKSHFGFQSRLLAPLGVLMAVCAVLLLIVCANVGNLLLARFAVRRKEFSLRLALGAQGWRLARQIMAESFVLALAGAVLGAVFALGAGKLLRGLLPPGDYGISLDFHLNRGVLLFIGVTCVASTLLCGLVPVLQAIRVNLNESLKEIGRGGSAGRHSHNVRKLLVLSEISLALVALIGAAVFVRSFHSAEKIDPEFDPDNVLLAQFNLSTSGYTVDQRSQFCYRLRESLETQPGVTAVAYSDAVPLGFEPSWWESIEIKGYQPSPGENMSIYRNVVSPGYFPLMHIPLVEGRDFTESDDDGKNTAQVMIVNQSFVKRYFGSTQAVGRQIHGWGDWFTVIGVAKDSKYNYLTEDPMPYLYVPFRQVYRADMPLAFYIRTQGDPNQSVDMLRRTVKQADPTISVSNVLPLRAYIGASLFTFKIAARLLTALGLLALLLVTVGLYSVMAYSVSQRTQEIGVRMTLGAQRSNVVGLVLREGMSLAIGGAVVGTVVAAGLVHVAAALSISGATMNGGGSLLVRGSSTDPFIYLGAVLFLCLVALPANYIPARRATKVDPSVALRSE
jgi:predicted permease